MSGVIVGKYKGSYLMAQGQQFVLLAAATGTDKGVGVVLPNLLNFADSVVVLDLKLENFKFTSRFRALHGQQVFLFAPFAEDRLSHRWNMLDALSRDPINRVGEVLAVGQVFYPGDCDPREKFWNDNARNLFLGLVLYLMETPSLPCTMGEVFRQSSGKGKPLKEHIQGLIAERVADKQPLSDDCRDAFARFLSSPENTFGNIVSTFHAPLLVFANPIVDAATSGSDFDIRALRRRRMSIYIGIQPGRLGDAALLVNMLFSQIIEQNTRELPENHADLKYQCLLILDEFTALGKVNILAKANGYIRGYNLRLLTIIQSIAQLESVYGAAETRTLITNHAVQIMYPPREQKDANEYSEMLGYFGQKAVTTGESSPRGWGQTGSSSSNASEHRRALMLPQELKEMPPRQEIIVVANVKPILCDKARYYEDHVFLDRLKAMSPTLARLDGAPGSGALGRLARRILPKRRPTENQLKHVAFVLKELSVPVPPLDLDLHRARIEQRTRPLAPGEAIDLSKLAFDTAGLPVFANAVPSPEQVGELVEQFFAQLDWVGTEDKDEVAVAVKGGADTGSADDGAVAQHQAARSAPRRDAAPSDSAAPAIKPRKARATARKRRPAPPPAQAAAPTQPPPPAGAIDLSALDN